MEMKAKIKEETKASQESQNSQFEGIQLSQVKQDQFEAKLKAMQVRQDLIKKYQTLLKKLQEE